MDGGVGRQFLILVVAGPVLQWCKSTNENNNNNADAAAAAAAYDDDDDDKRF